MAAKLTKKGRLIAKPSLKNINNANYSSD